MELDDDLLLIKAKCLGSLLFFTRFFYEQRTGREFQISHPDSNESHFITVCRELTKCFKGETTRLMINLPPGWGKSELCKHYIAWCLAHYPDSNFLYVSHSAELAEKHTHGIKQIIDFPFYRAMFGVEIRQDSASKAHFTTTAGGVVSGWGAKGGITGYDAGLPGQNRFSGALVIDDIHKPDEVHSETIREHIKRNYVETLERRLRSPRVPVIFIGQRLHEDDLPGNLVGTEKTEYKGYDGRKWDKAIIKALDPCGNAVYPELNPKDMLENLEQVSPYVFASQYQQDPQPAGGGIFKPQWFKLLDIEPSLEASFITVDTAETSKTYNDATVFSHFGLYRIPDAVGDIYGLHWIDCVEIRVEPKDLENEFMAFFDRACRHAVRPQAVGIEKKSTGVTLISNVRQLLGVRVVDIERNATQGSKMTRFLAMQPIVASKRISLPANGHHTEMCLEHMRKITANDTHKHDDIADTLESGIQLGLVARIIVPSVISEHRSGMVAKKVMGSFNRTLRIRKRSFGSQRAF